MDTCYTAVPIPIKDHQHSCFRKTVQDVKCVLSYGPCVFCIVGLVQTLLFLLVERDDQVFQLLQFSASHHSQLWRYLSYSLLHADTTHFLINLLLQTALAVPLEVEQGRIRTAAVYTFGVLAGSLGTAVLDPELNMVGASAGIYALLLAHLPNVIYNCDTLRYVWYRVISVVCLCAGDVLYTVLRQSGPIISWAAHISGASAGFLLGLALFTSCNDNSPLCMSLLRYAAIIVLTIFFLFSILYINTHKNKAILS